MFIVAVIFNSLKFDGPSVQHKALGIIKELLLNSAGFENRLPSKKKLFNQFRGLLRLTPAMGHPSWAGFLFVLSKTFN